MTHALARVVPADTATDLLTAPSGASASLEGETIVLRDAQGRVVVTFDAATGAASIAAPAGDLTLAAPHGRVVVRAATDVEVAGSGTVRLEGARIAAEASEACFTVERWELRAERAFERVRDAYRQVEGLLQTRARRARLLVGDVLQIASRRTRMRSSEQTSIDGKRVLLG